MVQPPTMEGKPLTLEEEGEASVLPPGVLISNLDGSDTVDGRYGNSLYMVLIEDLPEEVSNLSKVSRAGGRT